MNFDNKKLHEKKVSLYKEDTGPASPEAKEPSVEYDPVKQAQALLQQHISAKPGGYTPVWLDEADSYLKRYQNRDDFSYNINNDALYNQYKDQYIQNGQLAMMDAMGQAATMTGGYGNSYAQSVGQQAYNQQLNQLNNIVPELYGMAYDQYRQEGQDILDMYGLYMDREAMEYGKYQDKVNNWYDDLNRLSSQYQSLTSKPDSDGEVQNSVVSPETAEYWYKKLERVLGDGGTMDDLDAFSQEMLGAGLPESFVRAVLRSASSKVSGGAEPVKTGVPLYEPPVPENEDNGESWWDRFLKDLAGYQLPV